MPSEDATKFRAMVARCNVLVSDRPDLQFAAKEAPRSMATPRMGDREEVARMAKYPTSDYHRLVQRFPFR